ncbi:MAG: response regulator [Thermodesulfobacteriota bacterium]
MKKYSVFVVDHCHSSAEEAIRLLRHLPHFLYRCASISEFEHLVAGVMPDVVLCNLRLPGLAERGFFRFLQSRCPSAIRLVFSEQADLTALARLEASGLVHRGFSLPFGEAMVAAIEHDLAVRSRIRLRNCWEFMQHGQGLPLLPRVLQELERCLHDSSCSLGSIVGIIEQDPILSARLLRLANSALFRTGASIDSVHRAVSFLGLARTRKMALFLAAVNHFHYPKRFHAHALRIIEHSIQCGRLAGAIARVLEPGEENTAITAGLLHDIGKLVFLSSLDKRLRDSPSFMARYDLFATEVEEQAFGISHLELGSALLLWWNLPLVMVDVAANHSQPFHSLSGVPLYVAIADRCLMQAEFGDRITTGLGSLPRTYPVEEWLSFAQALVEQRDISIAA